jgi:antitoxin component YwqK of YwqJK toxin-antitoxin module
METIWYENSQKKSERNYKGDEDGVFSLLTNKREGKFTTWYENGQIKSEIHYKNNKRDGMETIWHENGQIMSKRNYKAGILI